MRNSFANRMTELAKTREDICLLSGDIGNRMFDSFKEVAPSRFLNCGIAEANMMSLAAGMALSGLRPVVYTITPFTTTRCLEQIRIGVAYHQAPVVIVGTGSGLSYAELGPTHHSLEDIALLRMLPDINVLAPSDSSQLVCQLDAALQSNRPSYIRIGKKGEPDLHSSIKKLEFGKACLLRDGTELLVLGVGPILGEALKAAQSLAMSGVSVAVADLGSVRPLDDGFLEAMLKRFRRWVSLEEHCVSGGLGTVLLEWLNERANGGKTSLKRVGAPNEFIHHLGSQDFVRANLGLNAASLKEVFRKEANEQV